ncbi:hypothetical protein [Phocicoccus pinnipedialis]|uniref:Sodium/glutamate symporter n=1 Tax=Phocicoccus pinnipedialis TaxID=110845 RepID=A0A6V7RG32_9BACL|nr:hypothetical protein [Jeotgalicoccus pinnipedialis]MBP1939249.1 hypothetical protein [Jeotgalicoccus pinnipedialis]CAD2076145.1 hypothetical protein JEOPIN946_01190 [Jeotgalicoccus pinnipedialis]
MNFEPIVAFFLLLLLLAIGEIISIWTRARIPMLLVAMIGYLVLTWTGVFPENITDQSTIPALASVAIAPLIVHMGTLMGLDVLRKQWRAVVIALGGLAGSLILVLTIITLIFDFQTAASGIGPISGGVIALLITTERLTELGLTSIIVIPIMIQAFQSPIGMPLATYFMRNYSKYFLSHKEQFKESYALSFNEENHATKRPNILQNNIILLTIVIGFGALAMLLGNVTPIHYTLYSLVFGILLVHLKIIPKAVLDKANSFSFLMVALMIVVINTMGGITPSDVINNLPAVLMLLLVGISGLLIGGFIVSKLVGWHPNKGMPVALTALFGFPADYILCEEVARGETDNERDRKVLFDELVSPMVIGGFVTVTISSVFIASIIMGMI